MMFLSHKFKPSQKKLFSSNQNTKTKRTKKMTQINTTFTENIVTNVNKKTSSFLYLIPAVTLGVAILFIKWVI